MKDTVQELVDALDVMSTSILERITDTWILRFKIKPGTSEISLTLTQREELPQQDPVGPDVALAAEQVLEEALRRHPPDGQEALRT